MPNTNLKSAETTSLNFTEKSSSPRKKNVPEGLWTKCLSCAHVVYSKSLRENLSVCPKCGYHFVLGAKERLEQLIDAASFKELDARLTTRDPLHFKGSKSYLDKVKQEQRKTGLEEAAVTGSGLCGGIKIAFG